MAGKCLCFDRMRELSRNGFVIDVNYLGDRAAHGLIFTCAACQVCYRLVARRGYNLEALHDVIRAGAR